MGELKNKISNSLINVNKIKNNKNIEQGGRDEQFPRENLILDDIDMKDENKNKYVVKFEREVIKIEVLNTKCQYIFVDDIKIENIGNEVLKNLCFIRDEKQSSENFIFFQTSKINVHKLYCCWEKFKLFKIGTHSIVSRINNPDLIKDTN